MADFSSLPRSFSKLREQVPIGYELSERIIRPAIIIESTANKIVARLGGYRTSGEERLTLLAPTSEHAWVVDGSTLRPLPTDVAAAFETILSGADPSDLRYSDVVRLLRHDKPDFWIQVEPTLTVAGHLAANALPIDLVVPGLTAELYPYQSRGVRWMSETTARLGGVILADEMGLGKTLQIIALLTLHLPPVTAPALIICPTSLIANWVREFNRFSEGVSILVHRGADRAGTFRDLQHTHVVIATYDTVVNDIALFSSFEWSWVICDEAQAIKNPSSNRRMAIATIPRRKAIPMTGTPVENTLVDLWSLADFAIPGLLGSQGEFEQLFPDTVEAAAALATLTDPIIIKRKVSEVAGDLPDRIEVDLPLELTEALASHYCQVRDETIAKYPAAGHLVATLQLQLVCAHPWLRSTLGDAEGDTAEVSRRPGISLITPKMERTIALIKESFLTGNKVVVFSLFNRIGELLLEAAPELQHAFWGAINGSTPQAERQPLIDRFSNYDGPACLVLNPKAAGAGLNITAATTVIHFTPLWNPATEAQASARAHRRGQTRPVTIYRLYYEDTVERVMIDRSQWKSELGNEIVPLSSRDATDLQRALKIGPVRR